MTKDADGRGASDLCDLLGVAPERAEFEKWFSDGGRHPQAVERAGNGYKLMSAHSAWTTWKAAWQASKEAHGPVPNS